MARIKLELSLSNDISELIKYHEEILKIISHNISKDSLSKQEDILEILKAFELMEKASNLNS